MKAIVNKKATFNYEILEKYQAGLVLLGHEVKAIKNNQLNLKGSYISVKNKPKTELFLTNANIARYKKSGPLPDYNPLRPRKLLLKKSEIRNLSQKLQQKGLTLIPIKVYTKDNRIKLEIGLARGKKKADKRETIKKREADRDMARLMRQK